MYEQLRAKKTNFFRIGLWLLTGAVHAWFIWHRFGPFPESATYAQWLVPAMGLWLGMDLAHNLVLVIIEFVQEWWGSLNKAKEKNP